MIVTGALQNETVVGILAASILIIVFLEMLRSSKIHIFQRTKKFEWEWECFEYSGMFKFWTINLHNYLTNLQTCVEGSLYYYCSLPGILISTGDLLSLVGVHPLFLKDCGWEIVD